MGQSPWLAGRGTHFPLATVPLCVAISGTHGGGEAQPLRSRPALTIRVSKSTGSPNTPASGHLGAERKLWPLDPVVFLVWDAARTMHLSVQQTLTRQHILCWAWATAHCLGFSGSCFASLNLCSIRCKSPNTEKHCLCGNSFSADSLHCLCSLSIL